MKPRKPTHSVYRDRSPGPRELKRRAVEDLYAKAEQKPQRPVSPPQELKKSGDRP